MSQTHRRDNPSISSTISNRSERGSKQNGHVSPSHPELAATTLTYIIPTELYNPRSRLSKLKIFYLIPPPRSPRSNLPLHAFSSLSSSFSNPSLIGANSNVTRRKSATSTSVWETTSTP